MPASDRTTVAQRPGPVTLASITLVARAPATEITATATDQVIPGGQISVQASITNAGAATANGYHAGDAATCWHDAGLCRHSGDL